MPSVTYWDDKENTITLTISQSAKDIILISSRFIENYNAQYYPTPEAIAEQVNNELPIGATITNEDVNIASTILANVHRTVFGEVNEQKTVSMLVSAFNESMSLRIVEKPSFIKDFSIIFILILGGYLLIAKDRERRND